MEYARQVGGVEIMTENKKLKVRKSSWFLKFYRHFWDYYPDNLCEYGRGLLFAFIVSLFLAILLPIWGPFYLICRICSRYPIHESCINTVTSITNTNKFRTIMSYMTLPIIILVSGGWLTLVIMFVANLINLDNEGFVGGMCFISLFGGMIGLLLGSFTYVICKESYKFHGPGMNNDLFWEWVLAKKRKICPLIEVVD